MGEGYCLLRCLPLWLQHQLILYIATCFCPCVNAEGPLLKNCRNESSPASWSTLILMQPLRSGLLTLSHELPTFHLVFSKPT